jgi:hypothetical protein
MTPVTPQWSMALKNGVDIFLDQLSQDQWEPHLRIKKWHVHSVIAIAVPGSAVIDAIIRIQLTMQDGRL